MPSKFEVFAVYEPKRRMVHAPAFVDKVVLHALVDNILYDALTKSFIRDSHASQTGKGTDDGLMRLKTHMVDYYRREDHGADGWVLKGDVRHFFASIDHRKLKRKLKAVLDKRGVDPRVYELLCIYIDVMEDGLPLGYQTSQLFALMFWMSSTTSSKRSTASNTMADTWMISISSVRTRRNCSAFSGMFGRLWTVTALS